jgi:hypothetical protein
MKGIRRSVAIFGNVRSVSKSARLQREEGENEEKSTNLHFLLVGSDYIRKEHKLERISLVM